MSIASQITRIQNNICEAYSACNHKGASMPQAQNSANLADTIESIQTGIIPSGTKSILTNGTHDVTQYASANVNVPVGIFPSGTTSITSNGTYNVTNQASAVVAVPTGVFPTKRSFSQMNAKAASFLSEVTYDPSDYTVSHIDEYASVSTPYRKDRPASASVTLPSAGTIMICDGSKSVDNSVSAGTFGITNLTPNKTADYSLRDLSGNIAAAGALTPTGALRMIDAGGGTFNIRDLGGWSCDGGTLRYGLVFRGCELNGDNYHIELSETQKRFFRDYLGIRDEIDLRGNSEVDGDDEIYGTDDDIMESALGDAVDYIRRPVAPYSAGVNLSNEIQKGYYALLLKRIATDITAGKPCYIHCMAGADRTGTLCALIEAICGVSQSDIDKEYELTSFASGNFRARTNAEWTGFISMINSFSGNTFRDKVVNYALQIGVTIDEINDMRAAFINGTPSALTSPYSNASVSRSLTHTTTDNTGNTTARYQPYAANIIPDNGYIITNVRVMMDGNDITSSAFSGIKTVFRHSVTNSLTNCITNNNKISAVDGEGYGATITPDPDYTLDGAVVTILMGGNNVSNYYSNGKIAIPRVTGDLVITIQAATSAPAYTNQIPISTDASGAIYNSVGYQNSIRLNSSGAESSAQSDVMTTGFIPYNYGDTIRVDKFSSATTNNQASGIFFYNANKGYLGGRKLIDMISDNELVSGNMLVYNPNTEIYDRGAGSNKNITSAKYIRIVFHDAATGQASLIATINEEIA